MKNPRPTMSYQKPKQGGGVKQSVSKEREEKNEQSVGDVNLNGIALSIIEAVQGELNSIDSQSLLTNLINILQIFEADVSSIVGESNFQNSDLEELIRKNMDIIGNYFIKCLQIFDKVKENSIDNLKCCLTQLFEIISNELNNKKGVSVGIQPQMLITKEENFVFLINSLSNSIKTFMKSTKSVLKESSSTIESVVNLGTQYKNALEALNVQVNLPNFNKSNFSTLKENTMVLCQNIDTLIRLNNEMASQMKSVDSYSIKFYDEAKEIFKNLKLLHNEKMTELKKISEDDNQNNFESSPVPPKEKMFEKIPLSQTSKASNKNYRKNQSVSPTRKRYNTNASTIHTRNNQEKQMKKEFNKSSEHISKAKRFAQKKLENKQLSVSTLNTGNKSDISTTNNITTQNNTSYIVTELNEKNKELQFELSKLSNENEQLKINFSNLKQTYDKLISSSNQTNMKSKSLRNVLTKNPNMKLNENEMELNFENICQDLSQRVVSFIGSMRDLQNSIMKKVSNVTELKRNFEKEKIELMQYAKAVNEGNFNKLVEEKGLHSNSNKNIVPSLENNSNIQKKFESMEKVCRDYESVIKNLGEEINEKNSQITKLTNELSSKVEVKKGIPNQAKIKELENKINSYKTENEQLKASYEEKIKELNTQISTKDKAVKPDTQISEIQKENEQLKKKFDEMNKTYKKQIDDLKSNEKKNLSANEEAQIKIQAMLNELTNKAKEIASLTNSKSEIEKQNKLYQNKILSLDSEIKQIKEINQTLSLENQNFKKEGEKDENEAQTKSTVVNDADAIKKENAKLKEQISSYTVEIKKLTGQLKEQNLKDQAAQNEYKNKLKHKDLEINELKETIAKGSESKDKDKPPKTYKTELIEVSSMIKTIHNLLNAKYKEMRLVSSSQEIRRNPNEAFLIYEQDEKDEDSILSGVNNSMDEESENEKISSDKIHVLLEKTKSNYNEITQIANIMFGLLEKNSKSKQLDPFTSSKDKKTKKSKEAQNQPTQMDSSEIKNLKEENLFLKNFFSECTNTIFDSIKQMAPHMIDEESDISFNIISGSNTPNLLDNIKNSPSISPNTGTQQFDPELISAAVSKFKSYNKEINDQLKKLTEEKEEFEKEAHNNLVKANAYKTALDDAIQKINSNINDDNNNKSNNGNSNSNSNHNSMNNNINIQDGEARAFTVEDLEGPQSGQNNSDYRNKKENQKSTSDLQKMNEDLLSIQTDLLKKIEMKDEENEKLQGNINQLIQINNEKSFSNPDLLVKGEKYQQLLELYTQEQEKNQELRTSYYKFVTEFSEFVQTGKVQLPKKKKDEITLGNEGYYSNEEEMSEEDYNPAKKPQKNNKTHLLKSNTKDYLAMLNEKDINLNNSAGIGMNELQIQEILNEKKSLEEQEGLLMTQLNAVKEELKETREKLKKSENENERLKGSKKGLNDDVLGTLRNALERLIYEIQLTPKVKEFLTVILRIVGYTDDQILAIYQSKEKKKGFFNMFK